MKNKVMNRFLHLVPILVITFFMTAGEITRFRPAVMQPLVLILWLVNVLLVIFLQQKKQASPIEKSFLAYISLAATGLWLWPSGLGRMILSFPVPILYTVLLLTAIGPPLLGAEPFTMFFARKTTPATVWDTEIFKTINRNMTRVWAGLFSICLLSSLIPDMFGRSNSRVWGVFFRFILPAVFLLILGRLLNRNYPRYYQNKLGLKPIEQSSNKKVQSAELPLAGKELVMPDKGLVVAVNGSPHAGIGNTSMMLEMLRATLTEEGFDLEVINLSEKRIEYCLGCALCLEKGKCWRRDDHAGVVQRLLEADGIILACPVYFMSVTGQMKTFLDRCLAYGHKPRPTWKPGLAVSVAAAFGETTVAEYLATLLRVFGAFSVGTFTSLATKPGEFLGKETVEMRAVDLARDLARAIKEKRRYPGSEKDLFFYLLMGDLIRRDKDLMKDDYKHWEEQGFYQGFENYVQQDFARGQFDLNMRKAWIENIIAEERVKTKLHRQAAEPSDSAPIEARTCREVLGIMPLGFRPEAAGDLKAVYQFEISGSENFTAHLKIEEGKCIFQEGPSQNPSVVIKSPAQVWLGISKGEINGQSAFMSGQYKVEGDLSLLLQLNNLFKR